MLIAGVDEAGRGPLAGPVFAAAVILPPDHPIIGLKDSKKLSEKQRETLANAIKQHALSFAIGRAEVAEIDKLNILQATLLAMQRAIAALTLEPHLILVDGNQCPKVKQPVKAIIKGDQTEQVISAASILAKVARDHEMLILDQHYPQYGFAQHKGYGTQQHLAALKKYGPADIHRMTFAPVKLARKEYTVI